MSLNEILIVGVIIAGAFCLIFFFIARSVRKEIEDDNVHRLIREQREAILEQCKKLEAIKNCPVKELTQKEFDKIPKAYSFPAGFLKTCPINFWFVCRKSDIAPNITVVGQVVKGDDIFVEQWGAGLCVPERGINRYRVEIVESKEEAETVIKAN